MALIDLVETNNFEDDRGGLIEIKGNVIRNNNKHMFFSYTKANALIPRGNHYHKYKNERFYILQGKIRLKVDNMNGLQEEYFFDQDLKQFIHIGPNLAHTFRNIGDKELILIAIVDRKFNRNKPDTYSYIIQ